MTLRRVKWLVGIIFLFVITLCVVLFWLFNGQDILIQNSLRLYPGLENVGEAYGYYGADTGLKITYYWTGDSTNQVEKYYSEFTYPFIDDPYQENMLLTVYNVSNADLVYYPSVSSGKQEFSYPIDNYCHYTQAYKCINIRLIDNTSKRLTALPIMVSPPSWTNVMNPLPIAARNNGTLVIYSYFVNDF